MGFFEKIKQGLKRTKDSIGEGLNGIFATFRKVDEDLLEELEEILISADVGFAATEEIMEELRERIKDGRLKEKEQVMDALREIMTDMIGESQPLTLTTTPSVLLVIGVNGAGKTTSIGKISKRLRLAGKTVVVAAADTFRAAAIDQLAVWADRAGATMIRQEMGSDPASVAYDTLKSAVANGADVVLIDTAGRLHNKIGLMNELTKIRNVMAKVIPDAPHEVMLVLDGSTGQNAFEQARQFTAATQVTSLAITKLDGTAKGGVVIGISDSFRIPVRYIGIGEGIDQLKIFDRHDFVKALFGK